MSAIIEKKDSVSMTPRIGTRPTSQAYREGWERIWGPRKYADPFQAERERVHHDYDQIFNETEKQASERRYRENWERIWGKQTIEFRDSYKQPSADMQWCVSFDRGVEDKQTDDAGLDASGSGE